MKKLIVIAGVSGSGKTTIGLLLSEKLNIPFKDADDYHPQANVDKMKSGVPLNDDDRKPWLEILDQKLQEWDDKEGAILACSALKESYRKILAKHVDLFWVFLDGSFEVLKSRLDDRKDHFFDPLLLQSQLDTLESPDYGIHVSINQTVEEIVDEILKKLDF
ncbi:gluconokinase [Leeuwenhoekiella sp. MAR_2009_132]|uniref:gluconokinase n=1 Tax=Leeuwenhoekiella sp. MAR_2009_132 TaxID=1392489 RepID=UPI00048E1971|nr:gluconokinase [Leeuwenhoekiella sp. MAR_2009_132]